MSAATVNFTLDDVVAKVREVAAERPTYIYNNGGMSEFTSYCFYRHGKDRREPGCIVGHALERLGYKVPEEFEGNHSSVLLSNLLGLKVTNDVEQATIPALHWIRTVQGEQDSGKSWGDAIAEADSYITVMV